MSGDYHQLSRERLIEDVEQLSCAASHELKDPLREALGMVDALGILDHRTALIKERLNQVIQRADHIREYSALVKQSVSREEQADLNQSLIAARQHAEFAALQVRATPLPVISGQQALWNRLFIEMARNALQHNDSLYPELHIDTYCSESQRVICFRDNGTGIAPEHRVMIFGLFRHGGEGDEEVKAGAGCGLAYCKRIVQLHGGEIYAISQSGTGSEFRIILPLEETEALLGTPLLHDIMINY